MALALLFALAPSVSSSQEPVVSDDYGSTLVVKKPFQRVISLTPSVTEDIYSLGAQDQLVGVTTYCDYPPQARYKPQVGDIVRPNVERILNLNPDLILCAGNALQVTKKLADMGVPCLVFRSESLADIRHDLQRLGTLLGREEQARTLCLDMDEQIKTVRTNAALRQTPKAVLAFDLKPLIVAGEKTLGDELLNLIGCQNVGRAAQGRYPNLSVEFLIQERPEFFFYAGKGTEEETLALRSEWVEWTSIPAVSKGHIYSVSADLVSRPSLRLLEGLRGLEKILGEETQPVALGEED